MLPVSLSSKYSLISKAHHSLDTVDQCSKNTSFCRPLASVIHLSSDVLGLVHIFSGVLSIDGRTLTKLEGETKTSHQKLQAPKIVGSFLKQNNLSLHMTWCCNTEFKLPPCRQRLTDNSHPTVMQSP